jgi:uncharacterized delta-60 repeat protein
MLTRLDLSLLALTSLGSLALMACSDDEDSNPGTGGSPTTTTTTGGQGGGGQGGAPGGAGGEAGEGGVGGEGGFGGEGGAPPFVVPAPFAVPLSAAGPDQLQSVTAAPTAGEFYAAGFAATAVGGDRIVTVVKLTPMGLAAGFGTGGVAATGVVFVGGNDEIDITTQSDGKILVSATVANPAIAGDRDIAVIRLHDDGTLDNDFGTGGVARINLNDAHDNGMLVGLDAARSITVDASDSIFVHGASRGLGNAMLGGPRIDTDFTVVKLDGDGDVVNAFGESGQFRHDIAETNATARGIQALADGSLIASGYANTPDVGDTTQPVLYKLTDDGELDDTWGTDGVFHTAVLATQTEVYNFAIHGANFVTAGYGRNTGDTNDYVSLRFNLATGVRDTTWGGAVNGAVLVDPSGTMLGSNARNAIGLPDGATVIIGSTGPGNMPAQDAVFVVLDADGVLDTRYGDGIHLFPLGDDGNDQFWGGAVSGDHVAIVGYQGGGTMQTDMVNDDAYGIVFEMQP